MPRAINKKCGSCAFLDIAESREQPCWENKCNTKRNYYYYRTRNSKLQSKVRNRGCKKPTLVRGGVNGYHHFTLVKYYLYTLR